jgi:hypothetical protein
MIGYSRADTWADFLFAIRDFRDLLGNPETVWYRGQSRVDYKLVPSLFRMPKGISSERPLFMEYQKSAARLQAARADDWQILFDMQHYGLPTRLLDWTTVLGVAVTFAIIDGNDDEDSAIYVLDPIALNKKSGIGAIRRVPENEDDFNYKKMYWEGRPLIPVLPIAIDSNFTNDRIAAQNGTFTVHGSEQEPFDSSKDNYVFRVILGKGAKREAREFLEYANLNAFSIYPDMVGMVHHLKSKYFSS